MPRENVATTRGAAPCQSAITIKSARWPSRPNSLRSARPSARAGFVETSAQASESESKEGIGDALGWAPFPEVEGGAGLPTDVFGGGDNFIVGRDAPAEAVEFAKWLTTDPDIVAQWVASGDAILPTLNGSEELTTDPNMQSILEARGNATFAQGYLDQVTSPELGATINEQVGGLVAGALSPEEVVQAITAVATAQ